MHNLPHYSVITRILYTPCTIMHSHTLLVFLYIIPSTIPAPNA